LKGKVRNIDYVYKVNDDFEDFEKKLKRTTFGKKIISADDLKKLGNTFNSLQAKAIEKTELNKSLEKELKNTERAYEVSNKYKEELIQEKKELEGKMNTLENRGIVYRDILKNDYGVMNISPEEFKARIVLNRVENNSKPRNRKQGEFWVDTLENARGTKIEPSRLERGIYKAKELLEKVIEMSKNMYRGLNR